jgi:hypothetical protein
LDVRERAHSGIPTRPGCGTMVCVCLFGKERLTINHTCYKFSWVGNGPPVASVIPQDDVNNLHWFWTDLGKFESYPWRELSD